MDEDEEFRLAVAAKLGLLEILNELRKLREDFNKKLYQKSLEHNKRFEAIERKLLEHDEKFNAIDRRFESIEKELVLHRKLIEYNRRDVGALTEATISRFVYEDIKEIVKESGEKILKRRRNARIDGYDIDLLIETDKKVYVVEIEIQPSHSDVDSLVEKAKVVENAMKKLVKAILASIWIGVEVESYALSRGIEVFSSTDSSIRSF